MAETKKKKATKVESNEENVVVAGVHANNNTKSVVWAIFLLFIGVMFLFNTTGVINWNVWAVLWKFWPVFLILGGTRLLIGHSKLADWIIGIVAILCFSFIALTAYVSYSDSNLSFLPSSIRDRLVEYNENIFQSAGEIIEEEYTIAEEDYEDVEKREIALKIGASKFTVSDKEGNSYFYSNSEFYENLGRPEITEDIDEGILSVEFQPNVENVSLVATTSSPEYQIKIGNKEILSNFDIELGAGDGTLALEELLVENVALTVGAGAMRLDFSEVSLPSGTLNLEIGAGDVEVVIPEGTAFELDYELGLGEITSNSTTVATFAGTGEGYKSEGYDDAEKTVKIVATVGVGALSIDTN